MSCLCESLFYVPGDVRGPRAGSGPDGSGSYGMHK